MSEEPSGETVPLKVLIEKVVGQEKSVSEGNLLFDNMEPPPPICEGLQILEKKSSMNNAKILEELFREVAYSSDSTDEERFAGMYYNVKVRKVINELLELYRKEKLWGRGASLTSRKNELSGILITLTLEAFPGTNFNHLWDEEKRPKDPIQTEVAIYMNAVGKVEADLFNLIHDRLSLEEIKSLVFREGIDPEDFINTKPEQINGLLKTMRAAGLLDRVINYPSLLKPSKDGKDKQMEELQTRWNAVKGLGKELERRGRLNSRNTLFDSTRKEFNL